MKLSRIGFNPPERTSNRAHVQAGFTPLENPPCRLWRFTRLNTCCKIISSRNYLKDTCGLFVLIINCLFKVKKGNDCRWKLQPRLSFQTGFTLVELMIVLAIVAILAAVGGIALNSQMPKYRLKGDARSVASSLMLARMKATASGVQYAIEFDLNAAPQTYRLRLAGGAFESYTRELSSGVNIQSVNGTTSGIVQIIYNPNGSSSAGDVRLRLGNLTDGYQILLTPTTGRVNTENHWP